MGKDLQKSRHVPLCPRWNLLPRETFLFTNDQDPIYLPLMDAIQPSQNWSWQLGFIRCQELCQVLCCMPFNPKIAPCARRDYYQLYLQMRKWRHRKLFNFPKLGDSPVCGMHLDFDRGHLAPSSYVILPFYVPRTGLTRVWPCLELMSLQSQREHEMKADESWKWSLKIVWTIASSPWSEMA